MEPVQLDGSSLTLSDVAAASSGACRFLLSPEAKEKMNASRAVVENAVRSGEVVYGITTGFGVFSEVLVSPENVLLLQRNLILSHCAGVGEPHPVEVVRAMMLLRANALAKGLSGIRVAVVETLLRMLSEDIIPVVPSQGSVGASGDLAPLAHLAAALMGVGEVRHRGVRMKAVDALAAASIGTVAYEAKEGLAMINGTQGITAVGGLALHRAGQLVDLADAIGALTLDALKGTDAAFDSRIHEARPHPGQIEVARRLRALLAGSPLRESHRDCGKVQDAYSLRCMPQVHGAVRDAVAFATATFGREINSATDNPLIFSDGAVISGGTFHGAPVALACDIAAAALTDLASISERRIERLVNPQLSELPAFLVAEGGLNSGFMIAQVTAAALVAESRALSHPASVDSIPTSANKEDHVSMGPTAAWKMARITGNLASVLAIEAICAAQALEFRRPLTSSPPLEEIVATLRTRIAKWDHDRYLHDDLVAATELLPSIHAAVEKRMR
jgi:histidine ammonia-lyase